MRLFGYLIFLFLLATGLQAQDQNHLFIREVLPYYQDFSGSVVLVPDAPLYVQPDTNGKVVKKLPQLLPVKVLGSGYDELKKMYWYKVETGKTTGYLRLQDLAQQSFSREKKSYLLQMPYQDDDSLRILTYNTVQKVFTDTFSFAGPFYAEGYYRMNIQETALKNADVLLKITHIMPYCGGGENDFYFVDANGKMSFLVSAFTGGDIGYIEANTAWLPVETGNKKIQMVLQGDINMTKNQDKNIKSIYQAPADIPKTELVIIQTLNIETELDEKSDPVKDENCSEKTMVTKDVTSFYRWNGQKILN